MGFRFFDQRVDLKWGGEGVVDHARAHGGKVREVPGSRKASFTMGRGAFLDMIKIKKKTFRLLCPASPARDSMSNFCPLGRTLNHHGVFWQKDNPQLSLLRVDNNCPSDGRIIRAVISVGSGKRKRELIAVVGLKQGRGKRIRRPGIGSYDMIADIGIDPGYRHPPVDNHYLGIDACASDKDRGFR